MLGVSSAASRAEEQSHDAHHPEEPAAAAPKEGKLDAPAEAAQPADAKKPGGMMGGDHMSSMMKMMEEMHGKMMDGGMAMPPKGDKGPSSLAFNAIMAKMHQDMAITYSGNADVDFVKGMIPHHQAAVDMAKTVLAFGKDPDVKKVAEEVIKAQESEIAWMKEWLKKHGQ
jgi:uncharacterized protein (DUF305 family)